MNLSVDQTLTTRAARLVWVAREVLGPLGLDVIRIAGNSLNATAICDVNDIDVYPAHEDDWEYVSKLVADLKEGDPLKERLVFSASANALTFETSDGITVQFCSYYKASLEDLVDSFDFAHIQVGAELALVFGDVFDCFVDGTETVTYFTEAWTASRSLGTSEFVGSEYPLSSLIRLAKYTERGWFGRGGFIAETIRILVAIIERGFTDYEDYKDQLDAVDLGLVPEELSELEFAELYRLFELLHYPEEPEPEAPAALQISVSDGIGVVDKPG